VEGDIEGTDSIEPEPAAAVPEGVLVHALPECADLDRIRTDQYSGKLQLQACAVGLSINALMTCGGASVSSKKLQRSSSSYILRATCPVLLLSPTSESKSVSRTNS
jgi:hypothetical protein